tara:strand:- start:904 stop:1455 length:552 start_codon:yes stop_codon:yes gene_type:complete
MSDVTHCGNYDTRINSCSNLTTEYDCGTMDNPKHWAKDADDDGAHLCYWDSSNKKCKDDGQHCAVPCAPFELDSLGVRGNGPTKCENLSKSQCHYFRNSDNRRCVIRGENCVSPDGNEPICKGMGDHFDPSQTAYSARCPFGTDDSCNDICKNDHSYYSRGTEIMSYSCWPCCRNEKYCQCYV